MIKPIFEIKRMFQLYLFIFFFNVLLVTRLTCKSNKHMNAIECTVYCSSVLRCTWISLIGKKGLEVLIQGGVIDDVARHLLEQYGIPKRYIEVLDKTKK